MPKWLCTTLMALMFTADASAEEWKSSDEKISITLPDDGSFIARPHPLAEMTAIWSSKDGLQVVMVTEEQDAKNLPISIDEYAAGMASEIQGTVVSISREDSKSVPAYKLDIVGAANGRNFELLAKTLTFSGKTYTIACRVQSPAAPDERITKILNSLTILDPEPVIPKAKSNAYLMGRWIGRLAAVAIIIAAALVTLKIKRAIRHRGG